MAHLAPRPRGERRRRVGVGLSLAMLAGAALVAETPAVDRAALPPNVIVILSDDQSIGTLPSDPAAMPWLQGQIADPDGGWLWFPQAFLNTPLCCPSRATILTGGYSHHTGVPRNQDGELLNESDTLATRLHGAGYTTALIGKYLNRYPWTRGPYVPLGWDRWFAKRNLDKGTTYTDYQIVDQGVPLFVSDIPGGYATDYLAERAVGFLESQPAGLPYFMLFAPSAPHSPWTPAPRDEGAFDGVPIPMPRLRTMNHVRGAPEWVRSLRPIDPAAHRRLRIWRRRESETLLALDDAIRRLVETVDARGELENTVFIFLTDNGWSWGEHRWIGKRCPYDPCVRTPFAIRTPWADAATIDALVSNVDLAPTIAELAGVRPPLEDGLSLASILRGAPPGSLDRRAVLLEFAGDEDVPPWWGVRTRSFAYLRSDGGFVELYDVAGVRGAADPLQIHNVAGRRAYAPIVARLDAVLDELLGAGG